MHPIDAEPIFEKVVHKGKKYNEHVAFLLEDGRRTRMFDGCDHRENPIKVLNKLIKHVKKGEELVELFDGSDTIWYGIVAKRT